MDNNKQYTCEEIKMLLEIPSHDSATAVEDSQGILMYDLIKEQQLKNTLEVGFAYGKSGAYIMAASMSPHVAIDPFQDEYKNTGVKNIRKLGMEHNLNLYRDYSHAVLPQLLKEEKRYDFIFIDGDHKFDAIFVDYYYSDLLLRKGGYILFHDTWMRSTRLVESFVKNNRRDYRPVRTGVRNLALFRKEGNDSRPWMHFKEFYTLRSMVSYHSMLRVLN